MSVKKPTMPKISFMKFVVIFAMAAGLVMSPKLVETVEKGTYQVKQAAVTGQMSAKMTPGIWPQLFGDIDVWPKAETFFFTADRDTEEDTANDLSIVVRFNDGSTANISGTCRVVMPITESEAIALTTEKGHKTYRDVEQKLILPTIRNVLRSTANLMTARESYNEKRLDYISWAKDQIENGVYKTQEEVKEVEDLVTGEKTWKAVKVIRKDDKGNFMYEDNPLANTGIKLDNFEIKNFDYEDKVKQQIAKQQTARMNVETAKAEAEEARQNELKAIAEGKKNVAIAKYEKEEEKIRAVVDAQKDKEVAELQAQKKLEVAKLDKEAAAETKQANILEGEGLAEKKRLILAADGALQQKLDAYVRVNSMYAEAIKNYQGDWVPKTIMGSNGAAPGNGAQNLIDLFTVKAAKDLALDMEIKGQK
jgi:regulator of protease activity HflC (stomatin/prohibitin superfamily)